MGQLLYTVEEILDGGDKGYLKKFDKSHYQIPIYQRGYKWNTSQVHKLLEDIKNFNTDSSKFYCLQNITLVPSDTNEAFNVVDGQQRLATLAVILSYLGMADFVKGRIRFPKKSIREETNRFFQEVIFADVQQLLAGSIWNQF